MYAMYITRGRAVW